MYSNLSCHIIDCSFIHMNSAETLTLIITYFYFRELERKKTTWILEDFVFPRIELLKHP